MKTLIFGYGNVTRSDDGAGVYAAELIEQAGLPDTEVRTAQQLPLELLEDFSRFRRIILLDVGLLEDQVSLVRVETKGEAPLSSSHALSPGLLLELASRIGYGNTELYVCQIPGKRFEFGPLSNETKENAKKAAVMVSSLMQERRAYA